MRSARGRARPTTRARQQQQNSSIHAGDDDGWVQSKQESGARRLRPYPYPSFRNESSDDDDDANGDSSALQEKENEKEEHDFAENLEQVDAELQQITHDMMHKHARAEYGDKPSRIVEQLVPAMAERKQNTCATQDVLTWMRGCADAGQMPFDDGMCSLSSASFCNVNGIKDRDVQAHLTCHGGPHVFERYERYGALQSEQVLNRVSCVLFEQCQNIQHPVKAEVLTWMATTIMSRIQLDMMEVHGLIATLRANQHRWQQWLSRNVPSPPGAGQRISREHQQLALDWFTVSKWTADALWNMLEAHMLQKDGIQLHKQLPQAQEPVNEIEQKQVQTPANHRQDLDTILGALAMSLRLDDTGNRMERRRAMIDLCKQLNQQKWVDYLSSRTTFGYGWPGPQYSLSQKETLALNAPLLDKYLPLFPNARCAESVLGVRSADHLSELRHVAELRQQQAVTKSAAASASPHEDTKHALVRKDDDPQKKENDLMLVLGALAESIRSDWGGNIEQRLQAMQDMSRLLGKPDWASTLAREASSCIADGRFIRHKEIWPGPYGVLSQQQTLALDPTLLEQYFPLFPHPIESLGVVSLQQVAQLRQQPAEQIETEPVSFVQRMLMNSK